MLCGVRSAISKHFRVHLKCGTNSGSYFSCPIRRFMPRPTSLHALHGMLSSDTHLRQQQPLGPFPLLNTVVAAAIVRDAWQSSSLVFFFFCLLPIIFTKKLHTQKPQRCKSRQVQQVTAQPPVATQLLTSLPRNSHLRAGNSRVEPGKDFQLAYGCQVVPAPLPACQRLKVLDRAKLWLSVLASCCRLRNSLNLPKYFRLKDFRPGPARTGPARRSA